MAKNKKEEKVEELQDQATTTPTQVTEEELASLRQVRTNTANLVTELGQITLAEINLEKRRENAEEFLAALQANETELLKTLQEKYGLANIDLETGAITPAV